MHRPGGFAHCLHLLTERSLLHEQLRRRLPAVHTVHGGGQVGVGLATIGQDRGGLVGFDRLVTRNAHDKSVKRIALCGISEFKLIDQRFTRHKNSMPAQPAKCSIKHHRR